MVYILLFLLLLLLLHYCFVVGSCWDFLKYALYLFIGFRSVNIRLFVLYRVNVRCCKASKTAANCVVVVVVSVCIAFRIWFLLLFFNPSTHFFVYCFNGSWALLILLSCWLVIPQLYMICMRFNSILSFLTIKLLLVLLLLLKMLPPLLLLLPMLLLLFLLQLLLSLLYLQHVVAFSSDLFLLLSFTFPPAKRKAHQTHTHTHTQHATPTQNKGHQK